MTRRHQASGFTLVEIMVVIAVIALAGQLVLANLGALVPSTLLDSASRQLMGMIETLRSEAQLQSKIYQIELDLDEHRWRIILPPEERLVSDQMVVEDTGLDWRDLDHRIQFDSLQVPGGRIQRSGRTRIVMDKNGFTGDMILTLRMRGENDNKLAWSIQLRGLDRKSELSTSNQGEIPRLDLVTESHF